jgi:hypothetical protein
VQLAEAVVLEPGQDVCGGHALGDARLDHQGGPQLANERVDELSQTAVARHAELGLRLDRTGDERADELHGRAFRPAWGLTHDRRPSFFERDRVDTGPEGRIVVLGVGSSDHPAEVVGQGSLALPGGHDGPPVGCIGMTIALVGEAAG